MVKKSVGAGTEKRSNPLDKGISVNASFWN